jgi:hypothetical protein
MDGRETLRQWYRLADQLITASSHRDLAETARILALNCAHYASRCGELPLADHLDFLRAESLSDEQAAPLSAGLQTLVGVLGTVTQQTKSDSRMQ